MKNRIITIENIDILVDDSTYDYYWKQRLVGENSDVYKVACRRILGLAPNDHRFIPSHFQFDIWGMDRDKAYNILSNSALILYEELWCSQYNSTPSSAYRAAQREKMIESYDAEFEDELNLDDI